MESAKKNLDENTQNGNNNADDKIYYGVFCPNKLQNESPLVYTNKTEVLQLVKQHKTARFKAFQFYHDAVSFALHGIENPNNNFQVDSSGKAEPVAAVGEKPTPFKGPKPQDLILFRKCIEMGKIKDVETKIWTNPRVLISSGDTPCILQEGSRYNALHVAAKCKNAPIAELVLNIVSSHDFITYLYGEDGAQSVMDRANMFLDLFLNTPDKGFNETPLHFASKFGAADVVEVLVSYPRCDKTLRNKHGETAAAIICTRADSNTSPGVKKKIERLLEDSYYVPVLRAEDNSIPPVIGEPFSPVKPPVFDQQNPSSPRLEIQAYAGPMDKKGAERFRKIWKTPPRVLRLNRTIASDSESIDRVSSLKFKDPLKGLEIVGKTLAKEYEVGWKEYWPFLDEFVDIASDDGLWLLENHLCDRFHRTMDDKYWNSLDVSSADQSSKCSTITDLCQAFNACKIDSSDGSVDRFDGSSFGKNGFSPFLCIEKACQVFANRISSWILNVNSDSLVQTLNGEIKQLESVVQSYSTDCRFVQVDFSCVHPRLAHLIVQKLHKAFDSARSRTADRISFLIDACAKSYDCFSSDDEMNFVATPPSKGTSIKKQFHCLTYQISTIFNGDKNPSDCDNLTEEDCARLWEITKPCACIFLSRRPKKRSSWQRNSTRKAGLNFNENFVGKKLFCDTKNEFTVPNEDCNDDFYTPPSSPSLMEDESEESDKEFQETDVCKVFIDGDVPSRTDYTVFNALKYANCNIDQCKYPNIYLWKHSVSLFSEEERLSWRPLKSSGSNNHQYQPTWTSTPQKSWLRVTGGYSPKKPQNLNMCSF